MPNKVGLMGALKYILSFYTILKHPTQKHEIFEISSTLSNMFEIAGQLVVPSIRLINKKANTETASYISRKPAKK